MIDCPECGCPNNDDAESCIECGYPLIQPKAKRTDNNANSPQIEHQSNSVNEKEQAALKSNAEQKAAKEKLDNLRAEYAALNESHQDTSEVDELNREIDKIEADLKRLSEEKKRQLAEQQEKRKQAEKRLDSLLKEYDSLKNNIIETANNDAINSEIKDVESKISEFKTISEKSNVNRIKNDKAEPADATSSNSALSKKDQSSSISEPTKQEEPVEDKCPVCGKKRIRNAKFCNICGYEYKHDQTSKRNTKYIIGIVLAALIFACLIGIGVINSIHNARLEKEQLALEALEADRQKSIDEYVASAKLLYDTIQKSTADFGTIDTMFGITNGVDANILTAEYLRSYVEGLCASEISDQKALRLEIDKVWESLNTSECNEPEIQELKKCVLNAYNAYCDRYDLLVNLNFTTANYELKAKNTKQNFTDKNSELFKELNTFN